MTEIHNGTKATCRYCGHEIIHEPWFRDGREPNEPVWSHIRSGTKSCSTRPVGWAADNWPFASPASRDGEEVAARTASGQQPETVPTPEEGIEDARKVIQHVLQLFLDRVPRNELDAETMADSVTDALSDGLTELYRSLAQAETALAAVGQPAEAQPADTSTWWTIQAQKPTGSWFNLSEGFSSADEARSWRDTELSEPRNWPLRIVRMEQTETVEDETR
jgi:hypothetical protein